MGGLRLLMALTDLKVSASISYGVQTFFVNFKANLKLSNIPFIQWLNANCCGSTAMCSVTVTF